MRHSWHSVTAEPHPCREGREGREGQEAPTADWTRPLMFLVEHVPATGEVLLDGAEGRHAAGVRRVRPGEVVLVGDGAGVRARATVTAVAAAAVTLTILARRVDEPPALRVTLVQALVKGDRGELAVELATEAGVDALVPWRAERSIARWDEGARGEKALARWRTAAREAAKQARRAAVPAVDDPLSTPELLRRVADAASALVLEGTAATSLADADLPARGELVLVAGPEGGITDAEHAALADAGALAVAMGPAVVRTSTAAAVALGALGARTDRWRSPR